MRTPRSIAVALAFGTVLTVGACSSGSPSASVAPSTAATTAPSGEESAQPSTEAPSATPYELAAVLMNVSDPFFATIACSAQAEADALGAKLNLVTAPAADDNVMAQNFDTAMLNNPQGIYVSPFNNNQFATQYKDLMSKGQPVVATNGTDPQVELKNIFSGGDTAVFAEQVLPLIPEGAGTMVYLGGAPGIPPLESRTLPFATAMEAARPDLKRLPNDYSGFDINKSTSNVNSLILANPDLKLIIASNGPDGQAAAAAVKQSNKVGEIAVIAFDATPPEVDALRAGTIQALIAQAPGQIGSEAIKTLVEYLDAHPDGGPVSPGGKQEISSGLLTKDNIDDPANAGYIYKAGC